MKRILSFLLVTVMSAGLLAGCGGTGNDTPTDTTEGTTSGTTTQDTTTTAPEQTDTKAADTSEPTSDSQSASGAYADYSGGFPENVTLEIPVFERAVEGWNVSDNYYTRWVQSDFGDKNNITVKFVPIPRQTQVADYQQLLAAHQAPDVIFHYDMPQALAYYSQEVMQPIDWNEIANYAPTYWGNMGGTIEQYGTVGDEKIFFFASRAEAFNIVNIVRKDWVEQVGMTVEEITSLEKFNEMLVKWKDAGLGKNGSRLIANSFTYNYRFRDWPVDEKYHALYSDLAVADFDTVATERFLRNLNYQYNNGLFDSEFYLRDEAGKTLAEFVAGRTGVIELTLTANDQTFQQVLENDPNAEFAALDPRALTPEGLVPQERAYWPFGMIMGVNYETTDEERIALWMYLEWLSQPANLFKFQNGVEGENYTLDANGLAVKYPDYAGEAKLSQQNNKDYWCLVAEVAQYDDPALTMKANIQSWSPAGYEYIIEDSIRFGQENAESRLPDALFTVVLETVAEYKADLNSLWQDLYVQCVICPEDQFDATYEDAKQTYYDAGYQAILDEKQAAIDAGNYVN
jgi:hypothetical protein